jgi:hypothetical protein
LNSEARAKVQVGGRETIRSFSHDVIGQRYRDLYRQIARGKP